LSLSNIPEVSPNGPVPNILLLQKSPSLCFLLICAANQDKKMEMGKRYSGKKFIDVLGKNPSEVEINNEGWGDFFAPAGSLSVWVEKV
jgi:alpha-amylase